MHQFLLRNERCTRRNRVLRNNTIDNKKIIDCLKKKPENEITQDEKDHHTKILEQREKLEKELKDIV